MTLIDSKQKAIQSNVQQRLLKEMFDVIDNEFDGMIFSEQVKHSLNVATELQDGTAGYVNMVTELERLFFITKLRELYNEYKDHTEFQTIRERAAETLK